MYIYSMGVHIRTPVIYELEKMKRGRPQKLYNISVKAPHWKGNGQERVYRVYPVCFGQSQLQRNTTTINVFIDGAQLTGIPLVSR